VAEQCVCVQQDILQCVCIDAGHDGSRNVVHLFS
jgi:hypothetical protein